MHSLFKLLGVTTTSILSLPVSLLLPPPLSLDIKTVSSNLQVLMHVPSVAVINSNPMTDPCDFDIAIATESCWS